MIVELKHTHDEPFRREEVCIETTVDKDSAQNVMNRLDHNHATNQRKIGIALEQWLDCQPNLRDRCHQNGWFLRTRDLTSVTNKLV